ncbi:MAG: anaerobic ribonucleoside-triphosphate reductase activating protein [Lachnospiraceae bacterium]|jgi:pyruvate formate lyase activating enzyme|nr:anaerobic ribonucleoside-triphosphate reductase activating protein [Lachnospiraceae bacterium]
MKVCGLNKTTLLDYPEHIAATVFTPGCNFRCSFCHNSKLIDPQENTSEISQAELGIFFRKRQGILEGVCITGGEPTLQGELEPFCRELKALGYLVKLDTNGSKPDVLHSLLQKRLVDYVSMDIKTTPEHYAIICGLSALDLNLINQSIRVLKESDIEYEFRTTVVKELHKESDIWKIGEWIMGAKRYFLQHFRENPNVLIQGYHSCSPKQMESYREIMQRFVKYVKIRG